MTVRLRPHHLLCMLTFIGKGYTAAFTANYHLIARRLSAGEEIVIVDGPDDICAPLLGETDAHCFRASVIERDRVSREAVETLLGLPARVGTSIRPDADFLHKMRDAFAAGSIRKACDGCEWAPLCTNVAASGFDGALVNFEAGRLS